MTRQLKWQKRNEVVEAQEERKKTLRKKVGKILVLFAAMGILFTGCGKTTQENETAQVQAEQDNAATGESTGEVYEGTVELTLWGAEEDQELLAEMVESFKAEYAGEADFEITLAVQGESDCRDVLLGDVQNGADVFAFADDQLRSMAAAGAIDVVENSKVKEENLEEAVEAASINGKVYAYPMTADNGYFLYYNKEFLSAEDVATLDGCLAVAAESGKKIVMDWTSGWYLYSFFGQTGMEMGLNEDGVTNFCNWNAQEGSIKGTDVAQAMLDIAANPGFSSMDDAAFLAGAQDGSVIAGISGVWNATAIKAAWGEDYGAVKLPTYTCAGTQVQMASFTGYKMVGVNAYSAHVEWAHKLADWITNEENQNLRFVKREQGPSNKNAAASEKVAKAPAIQAVIAQSEFGSLQRVGNSYWDPMTEFGQTMAEGNPQGIALQEIVDKLVNGVTASIVQ